MPRTNDEPAHDERILAESAPDEATPDESVLGEADSAERVPISRRRVLAGAGATAGTLLAAPAVTAQETQETQQTQEDPGGARLTLRMVVPAIEQFDRYEGQFLLVTDQLPRQATREAISNCTFNDWNPNKTQVYEVLLLDRLRQDNPPVVRTNGYVNADVASNVKPGEAYIISKRVRCPEDFVGLELERTEIEEIAPYTATFEPGSDDATDGNAAGFGVLGAVAGISIGALWRLRRDD